MKFHLLLACVAILHAEETGGGAKALFLDPTSRVQTVASAPVPAKKPGAQKAPPVVLAKEKRPPGEVTGLRYWIELKMPDGELKRVLADRAFKSGEKIRLHVESNVDGNLTILQSQSGAPFRRLYPRANENAAIAKFADTVIPSTTRYFTFDQEPGDIRLLIMVQARELAPTATPAAPLPPPNTQVAANLPPPPPLVNDDDAERRAMNQIERLKGSKALILEEEHDPQKAESIQIVKWNEIKDAEPGMIVVELKLSHR